MRWQRSCEAKDVPLLVPTQYDLIKVNLASWATLRAGGIPVPGAHHDPDKIRITGHRENWTYNVTHFLKCLPIVTSLWWERMWISLRKLVSIKGFHHGCYGVAPRTLGPRNLKRSAMIVCLSRPSLGRASETQPLLVHFTLLTRQQMMMMSPCLSSFSLAITTFINACKLTTT